MLVGTEQEWLDSWGSGGGVSEEGVFGCVCEEEWFLWDDSVFGEDECECWGMFSDVVR